MKPTAAAVIRKNRIASLLRTLAPIKRPSVPGSLFVLVAEAIADAAHREQVLGGARVPLELLPKVANVDIDGARVPVGGVSPDLLEEHLARLDPARRTGKRGEDLELDVGEVGALAAHGDDAALEVDLETTRGDRLLTAGPAADHLGAAERGPDAAAELTDRERLGDVVVGAHLQAEHLVDLIVLRREHDDRHLAPAPHPAADLDAVELRQHDVQNDQVESLLGETVQRLAAVVRGNDLVALLSQGVGQKRLHGLLVVDEQDACRRSVRSS